MLRTRSFLTITLFSATVLILLAGLFLYSHGTHNLDRFAPHLSSHEQSTPKEKPPFSISMLETGGAHDEVVAAFVHAFGSHAHAQLSLFLTRPRFGMSDIMANFSLPNPIPASKHPDNFGGPTAPNIVIATTCAFDLWGYHARFTELAKIKKTYLFCILHHSDHWDKPDHQDRLKPWLESNLISIVTLSPHTAKFFREKGMTTWDPKVREKAQNAVKTLTPVFPVSLPPLTIPNKTTAITTTSNGLPTTNNELAFAMQGNYEAWRRDFKGVFSDMGKLTSPDVSGATTFLPARNVTLHLLGSGTRPEVPDAIKSHIIFDENLSYSKYYDLLSETLAILPAFATDEYYDRKASSSVPAALLAGTPLIARKKLVDAYAYLGSETTYEQGDKESELAVMERVLKMRPEDIRDKKVKARDRCRRIVEENVGIVGGWLDEVEKQLGR